MSDETDSPPRPPASHPEDRADSPGAAAKKGRGRWRPLTWLGTLSTVVAVATGMFTLRDQILPSDSGNAMASTTSYEQAVGHVCDLVNQTTSEQPAINSELARAVPEATNASAQRNAVLSAWNQDLGDVQHDLTEFEGLQPPPASLSAQQRTTDHAWNSIVMQMRRFVEQLEGTNASGLRALVRQLPALNASISAEEQTRSSGLVNLAGGGGGYCTLSAQLPITIVTLPPLPGSQAAKPGGRANPSNTGSPSVTQPNQPTPPVNPPLAVTPPVNPPARSQPPQHGPGAIELRPSGSAGAASTP